MIITEFINSNPFIAGTGLAVKQVGASIPQRPAQQTTDTCICDNECPYVEKAFHSTDGLAYKNDQSSFLFKKEITGDTISLELHKNYVKVADIIDNTYGDYHPAGTFSNQPLYVGFVANWKDVYDQKGNGLYQIVAVNTILGEAETITSHVFHVQTYSDLLANGTVKIETYNTGNIIGSQFDYNDLLTGGWYQSVRIRGFFGFKTPQIEIDNYLTQDYELKQIQDKINPEYTLETELLPGFISNQLIYDNLLANRILITDGNIYNTELFRQIEVYPTDIDEATQPARTRTTKYTLKFRAKTEDNIKTNV